MDYYSQETERLILRKLTEEDIETWAEFFVDNPNARFIGMSLDEDKRVLAKTWIEKQLKRYADNQFGQLAAIDKTTGNFVGLGGILTRELSGKSEFEISYSMLPKYWGKGYATELAVGMKRYGLANNVSDKFISIIHKENEGSMNVARKNGMTNLYETTFYEMPVFVFGD
ncbi:MAG: ribosomal-protein-alanine N-acetyltransferase [Bacteroidia bacterium]|jgi:ribosomal-protein-alanine N-acetyltransferase